MFIGRKFELSLLIFLFIFSVWLMNKSFGYDAKTHYFRIARHQIGDFGLHLSLIRSFSWGDNFFPVESPFFPGKPLPYHYYFDLLVGILERIGMRIDVAFNGLSILFFTLLLYLIYKLPQVIFAKNKLLGIVSVILFIFHSNLTFISFLKEKRISLSIIRDLWYLPDYIHKGPFDGSLISIFFTLNVYLNQRHLIAALAISLGILYLLIPKIIEEKRISFKNVVLLGITLGMLSRVHTLIFLSTSVVLFFLLIFFRRFRLIFIIFIPALLIFLFHARDILSQNMHHIFLNPGFLSERPLSVNSFISFWFMNLGVSFFLIPIGFFYSNWNQKKVLLSILPLFVVGNIFQLSFRIDHNHSLFNYFFIFTNFYIAYFLITFSLKDMKRKLLFIVLFFFLTISGFIDLMAVKNDFQFYLADAPTNTFMQWIKTNTQKNDIFLSKQEILDPVTLSGRKNYLGHNYYLSVMGYNYTERLSRVKLYFEVNSEEVLVRMRKDSISYIVVPTKPIVDFHYSIKREFLEKSLKKVFQDDTVVVYKL